MNQEKIGIFIAECRKLKKLTQEQLAEKLGITAKAISKWETGKGLPDASIMLELCNILDITVNELLSGEKISRKDYQEKFEENIINTLSYGNEVIKEKNNLIGIILIIVGIISTITAMTIFPSESSWGSIYSITGGIISVIGISKFTKKLTYVKRLVCNYGYFLIFIIFLFIIDYISIININQPPRFTISKLTQDNVIIYKSPFCNVYRVNYNTKNEYYIIDKDKEYTIDSIPNIPFNRNKSGIDNIIKYKNKYLGNNSNTSNLINNLPLSEYGYTIEIDSENLGLTINYHATDWYINQNYYIEKSLIYNSVSIFALIDNIEYIYFNFSGTNYNITKTQLKEIFPNYEYIIKNGLNKKNFNTYLEDIINNNDLIIHLFKNLFIDENISKTTKIVIQGYEDKIINTITNKSEINEILTLISRATKITGPINSDGNAWNIYMYDKSNNLIQKFVGWQYNGYSTCFGLESKEYMLIGLDGQQFNELIEK